MSGNEVGYNTTEAMTAATGLEVAVIGMTGRFPGAKNIDEFWKNLTEGREAIAFFSQKEIEESGAQPELLKNPRYVKAYGWLDDIDQFDAAFFGYTPLEAEIMDPQIRIFHESVLAALENAGYDPYTHKKPIGLYAGASANFYWQGRAEMSGKNTILGQFPAKHLHDKDFLATRIAHRLNLKGPAMTLDTACSTSLVAIHMAWQGLLSGDCDMALAGGVTISLMQKEGYMYQEGMLHSPDGHCRAFDAKANGTNFGNAVAVVVLKRLGDALTDGDVIYAVIKGSYINNDGSRKAAYTAPSFEGQAGVIKTAHQMAEVEIESIRYVETHGTGTSLGDPVEIEGLKSAFNTSKKHFCAIGSVKTNLGHLEMAAGVTGFIKTVLALKHRLIPPSLFFETPNPRIDLENSPFYVINEPSPWQSDGYPLRAGVSSFGVGGTNVHLVLEEWCEDGGESPGEREYKLILLSAKTKSVLDRMTENLAEYLKKNPSVNLEDAAYTLQVGRGTFKHRRMLVCSEVKEAVALLSSPDSRKVNTHSSEEVNRPIVFLFSGIGSQYVNMGRGLYDKLSVFRKGMDRCFEILNTLVDENIKEILYPSTAANAEKINEPEIAQIVVFIFEYALTKLLIQWGIKPAAMIGYSFGEYVAACISGIFPLEDALKLVVTRGQLIRKVQVGAMLSVPITREELLPLLPGGISLAIDNGPSCIAAGPVEAVDAFEKQMKERKLMCMRVPASRALHSKMMNPISEEFEAIVGAVPLNKPQIPYISNVTGGWISDEEAVDPGYWARHLKQTVQFAQGMRELLKEPGSIFVEVGPGRDISALTLRHLERDENGEHQQRVINLVRQPHRDVPDIYYLLRKIGTLWLYGQPIDWEGFYGGERRRRTALPTYPFKRQRYWIDESRFTIGTSALSKKSRLYRKPDISDWFYIPSWKRSRPFSDKPWEVLGPSNWLMFMDQCGLGEHLQELLEKMGREGQDVIAVVVGSEFEKVNDQLYTINPQEDNHYVLLLRELCKDGRIPARIVHLWNVTSDIDETSEFHSVEKTLDRGFYSLLNLAKALGEENITSDIQIVVVSNKMQEVTGKDGIIPQKASILGPVRVIPAEYTHLSCRSIDIILPDQGTLEEKKLVNRLLKEFIAETTDQIIAFRDNHRWVQVFEPVRLEASNREASRLKEGGVYFITGGLGGIGLAVAQYLAKNVKVKLVLTSRTPLPPRDKWERWLKADGESERISQKIQKILEIEELGSQVLVFAADVGNPEQMQAVIAQTKEHFGRINGVIHLAGVADGAMIQVRGRKTSEQVFSAKIRGTLVLDHLLKDTSLDFFILCSSTGAMLSQIGQVGYCAANCFLDAFANSKFFHDGTFTSINWDRWQNLGIANIIEEQHKELTGEELAGGIEPGEGVEALGRILAEPLPQVIVSTRDLGALIEQSKSSDSSFFMGALAGISGSKKKTVYQRPDMDTEYVAPGNETEQIIAHIWENVFGFEQIGVRDDFFEMGGDSLKAMVVLSKIHKEIDVEVPIHEIFNRPTIEKLSQYINNADKNTYFSIEPAEEKEYYALSFAQKRLFILQEVAPNSVAYNESLVEVFEGHLAKVRLEKIFRTLIERHESLRTSFELREGEPVQRIHDIDHVAFEVEESPDNIIPNLSRPFDLSHAPLLRAAMIRKNDGKDILVVDIHHIISDGISLDLLIKDFKVLYEDNQLAELRIRYKDYTEWQNSERVQERIMQQEGYWLERFKGEIPVPNLPADYLRPVEQSFEGRTRKFKIDREQTQQLKILASREEATIFMKLLTIFYIFLFKISGQEDIVVGTPTAGRGHSDLEDIIGMFVNTLPLRNYPKGEKTFITFLKEVKEKTLGDFEHQEYPFEELIDKLNVVRDISRNPIFDIMFILHGMETRDSIDKSYNYEKKVSRFDLTLQGFESGENLFFRFEYCTKLFKDETIERFVGYFKNILSSVIERPHRKLWEIEIIADVEKDRVLYAFNNTAAQYPKDKTIHQLFEEQVERIPDNIAVVGRAQRAVNHAVTYKELNKKSNQLAHLLRARGVEEGTVAAIAAERSLEMVLGIFSVLKAGGAYLPIDPGYPGERINYILTDSKAGILLTAGDTANDIAFEKETIDLTDAINRIIVPTPHFSPRCFHRPSLPAYVIYTSGSTGKPKGVIVEQSSVINILIALQDRYPLMESGTYLLKTSYIFDVSITEFFGWFFEGGRIAILEKGGEKDPMKILTAIENQGITHINFVPSMFNVFLESLNPGNIGRLSPLKYIFLAGEAIVPEQMTKVRHLQLDEKIILENIYGPTEATIYASAYSLAHWDGTGGVRIPIGKPLTNVRIYILDKNGNLQPVGIPGELCISGTGVARGYLNRPELTAERFDHDLWDLQDSHDEEKKGTDKIFSSKKLLRGVQGGSILEKSPPGRRRHTLYKTGDLARWLPDGSIEFIGRIDNQVKVRGFRIELGEIENRLLKHEHIKEAVVATGGEEDVYLCAYFVSDAALTVPGLKDFLLRQLPAYMIPAYFVQIEKVPLTGGGKVDRKALPPPGDSRPKLGVDYVAPKTGEEKIIAETWKEVLKLERVGIHDNFFDIGGNSLKFIRVSNELNEALNRDIPVVKMFEYPTISAFLTYLSKAEKEADWLNKEIEQLDLKHDQAVNTMEQTLQAISEE